jgi:acetamidase/formamidase
MMRALFLCLPLLASAADLSGNWVVRLSRFGEQFDVTRMELKADGSKLTGTLDNDMKLEGSLEGAQLRLTASRANGGDPAKLEGKVEGDVITGIIKDRGDEASFRASRIVITKTAPKTHVFEPSAFHRVFSGAIVPVLHINPGDTIKTTTVDAGGRDSKGERRSMGGNPETGPFYVEGAMPGDTLSVKFNVIRLNRDSAASGERIVPSAVQANYYRNAKFDEKFDGDWKLDRAAGTATLAKPTDRLKNFKVKMQPMLGCVGVAPPSNQSFRSGWLGSWGGNMDFNGLREGVTVYLPVYQEGAILFLGDGHAAQGDGELNGDALETSMDVEFTVDLIRGQATQAPRFENAEYLMASGIAGGLQEALQQATTQLARWLERDYKLSANESNVVLGTSIEYQIAEIVDPQVHVVAKIRKAALEGLAR